MTTTPLKVQELSPGTADAWEGQGESAAVPGFEHNKVEQLITVDFRPVDPHSSYMPRKSTSDSGESLGSGAHDEILIGSLLDTRLRMQESVLLLMEREGEFYIAKCEELNEFGYGSDPIDAVQDIRNTIAELYWQLKENQGRLGSDLAKTWQILSELVHEA